MQDTALHSANLDVLRALYEAGVRGDIEGFTRLLDPQLIVNEPSFLPYGGLVRGRDNFLRLIPTIARHISLADIKIDSLFVDGETGFAIISTRSVTGEPVLMAEKATIRNGRIVELTIFVNEAGSLLSAT